MAERLSEQEIGRSPFDRFGEAASRFVSRGGFFAPNGIHFDLAEPAPRGRGSRPIPARQGAEELESRLRQKADEVGLVGRREADLTLSRTLPSACWPGLAASQTGHGSEHRATDRRHAVPVTVDPAHGTPGGARGIE
jgi:hypothetical protein